MSRILLVVGAGLTLVLHAPCQTTPAAPLSVSFDDALKRAQANSLQLLSAEIATKLAREDRVQAKSAMLPSVSILNQFIYTQPNGSESGVFVSNDGTHIYNHQAVVHGEIFSPARRAEYRMSIAAEAVAQARAEIAARGLRVAVTESFYGLVSARRRNANTRQSLTEAEQFLGITRKQESGGEVAHADVVKAQVQTEQRRRDAQEAELAMEKARVGLAVLIFPDFRQDFSVVDDLDTLRPLPPFAEILAQASRNSPDIRAAQGAVAANGLAKLVGQFAQQILAFEAAAGARNLAAQHFWIGKMLEEGHNVGEGFVERQHVRIAGLLEPAVHAVEQGMRRLVRHNIVRQARKHNAAGKMVARIGRRRRKVAKQQRLGLRAVESIRLAQRVRINPQPPHILISSSRQSAFRISISQRKLLCSRRGVVRRQRDGPGQATGDASRRSGSGTFPF